VSSDTEEVISAGSTLICAMDKDEQNKNERRQTGKNDFFIELILYIKRSSKTVNIIFYL
jgi:hypothetical protein